MPRIPLITSREQMAPEDRHVADTITAEHGKITATWPILLHCPEIAARTAHLGKFMRFESDMPRVQCELITLSVAREFNCEYTWGGHVPQATKAGLRREAVQAIANRDGLDAFTDEERPIIAFVRELLRKNRVSQPTFDAARDLLGVPGVVELVSRVGYYAMLAVGLNAFEVNAEELIYIPTDQDGVSDSEVRWFCTSCMQPFLMPKGEAPTQCPAGHRVGDPSLTSSIPKLPMP